MAHPTFEPFAIVRLIAHAGRIIVGSITGPLFLTPSDNPLTVASTGIIASTGANNDGIDGAAGTPWSITNLGTITSDGGWGVNLGDAGVLDNSGSISGLLGGFETVGFGQVTNKGEISGGLGNGVFGLGVLLGAGGTVANAKGGSIIGGVDIEGAFGAVTNDGAISKIAPRSSAVLLDAGGSVTNNEHGSILGAGRALGVIVNNGSGVVTNKGAISGAAGVFLGAGGSISNAKGGSIVGEGRGAAGVDIEGGVGVVANSGTISGTAGSGVFLGAGGSVTNAKGGSILGYDRREAGVAISNGVGVVTNDGKIDGGYGNGVVLDTGGSVENAKGGSIGAGLFGIGVWLGGSGTVTNMGTISGAQGGGVYLAAGGSVTNTKSGSISAGLRASGVDIGGAVGSITNAGSITGSGAGAGLEVGGSVINSGTISGTGSGLGIRSVGVDINAGSITNEASGLITGVMYGVETGAGPVTITNAGAISGGTDSVLFGAGSTGNRLVITPNAVFKGAVDATQATDSTIELAKGTGAIGGIGNGDFLGFSTLAADQEARWTLAGANTIATVQNDGELDVSGKLTVSTAVDPTSIGNFFLDHHATLEVAAAVGSNFKINFDTASELVVDDVSLFGHNVGTDAYAGPLLQDFSGSSIDLKDFGVAGLHDSFSAASGLLQLTNSAAQVATLDFQKSGLGPGAFHFASDGAGGLLVAHT